MSIDQFGIHIGSLYLRFYGMILMLGVVAAAYFASYEAKRRGKNVDFIWDSLLWVVIAGIIGARIWHIFTPPPSMVAQGITTKYYLTHPLEALSTWQGGLGIAGAVIGGMIALYFLCRKHEQDFLTWVDIIIPGVALAQAIGRWGNFINQEVYGAPTNLPWKIYIDPQFRLPEYADVAYYHPLFLYESLWSLASFLFLVWLARRYGDQLKPGDLLLTYLIAYPFMRIILDFLRLDASQVAGININQTAMIVVLVAAVGVLIYRHRFADRRKAA